MIRAVKDAARTIAGSLYRDSAQFSADFAGKVAIFMYHRVIPEHLLATTFVQAGMYVTAETFARHLRFLSSRFQLISMNDLLEKWDRGSWDQQARYCTITFDDGWRDNYQYAYPLLRHCGAPATIFLPTDLIGTQTTLWSDRLLSLLCHSRRTGAKPIEDFDAQIERLKSVPDAERDDFIDDLARAIGAGDPDERRLLDWQEAREMSQHGIAFGSHTCSHAILPRLGGAALERELRRPIEVLTAERVNTVPVLSYPNGDCTRHVAAAARAAGYHAAVTTQPGLESGNPQDRFQLRRISVHDDMTRSIPLLAFHIGHQVWQAN